MPFADELIGPDAARTLLRTIRNAAPSADLSLLTGSVDELGPLALRARADLLRDALLTGLPGDYAEFARTIRLAAENPDLQGWSIWPVTSAVAMKAVGGRYGSAVSAQHSAANGEPQAGAVQTAVAIVAGEEHLEHLLT